MNQGSTELWRKSEIVTIDKFPPSFHAPILKGLKVIRGEIPDDTYSEGMDIDAQPTYFSPEELDILREQLGPKLVHGNYSMQELRNIIDSNSQGPSTKVRRQFSSS
jgi:hypothetical protein